MRASRQDRESEKIANSLIEVEDIKMRALTMARHSVVKEEEEGWSAAEYEILSSGIKKEQPAELVDTEPSVNIKHLVGKLAEI